MMTVTVKQVDTGERYTLFTYGISFTTGKKFNVKVNTKMDINILNVFLSLKVGKG
jgi:hypothetical protein